MDVARPLLFVLPLAGALALTSCGYNLNPSSTGSANKATSTCGSSAVSNRMIVRWKDGSLSVEEADTREALSREVLEPYKSDIDFAEEDHVVKLFDGTPSQPAPSSSTGSLAAPDDWGQTDADASDAWSIADGSGVTVAVVDSGADLTHPQLIHQLATNAGETGTDASGHDKSTNGIDDDKNGYVDDVHGYDFAAGSPIVKDGSEGHGTHVSGIVLGEHLSDGTGIKGMAPKAKLLPLNFMSSDGSGNVSDALPALDYAVAQGARVINASWGGDGCSTLLQQKIASLEARGVLFVAAAGNGDEYGRGYNLDVHGQYPAAFAISGQLTVGAINMYDVMTGFSNYSTDLVHVMAPGWRIKSTFPVSYAKCPDGSANTDGHCFMDGTSMATPFVSGTAALLFSYRPKATVAQVKAALLASATQGGYQAVSKGRLNARAALDELAKNVSP